MQADAVSTVAYSAGVRKNAVLVLTHLVLNDMVKVKGQITALALRLRDPCPRIADLARLFFHELAGRAHKVSSPLTNILVSVSWRAWSGRLVQALCKEPLCKSRQDQDRCEWLRCSGCARELHLPADLLEPRLCQGCDKGPAP